MRIFDCKWLSIMLQLTNAKDIWAKCVRLFSRRDLSKCQIKCNNMKVSAVFTWFELTKRKEKKKHSTNYMRKTCIYQRQNEHENRKKNIVRIRSEPRDWKHDQRIHISVGYLFLTVRSFLFCIFYFLSALSFAVTWYRRRATEQKKIPSRLFYE